MIHRDLTTKATFPCLGWGAGSAGWKRHFYSWWAAAEEWGLDFPWSFWISKEPESWISLVVQWSRSRSSAFKAGGTGSISNQGTKIPHAMWCGQKIKTFKKSIKKKILKVPVDPFQMSWIGFGSVINDPGWALWFGGLINQWANIIESLLIGGPQNKPRRRSPMDSK